MKRFIINLLYFVAVTLIVLCSFHYVIIATQHRTLKLPENTTTVFLGNSTTEFGIDDTLIPNSFNWGLNGEVVDMMYLKLKALKQANPQLKRALVEFDDVILYKHNIEYITTHPYYLNQFTLNDLINNFKNQTFARSTDYLSHTYDLIKLRQIFHCYTASTSPKLLGMGGYENLNREMTVSSDSLPTVVEFKGRPTDLSMLPASNLYYFKAIEKYCQDNNIELIFLATPRHYTAWNDTKFRDIHRKYFPNVKLLDYTELSMPDTYFGDVYHLNPKGAQYLSLNIKRTLNDSI